MKSNMFSQNYNQNCLTINPKITLAGSVLASNLRTIAAIIAKLTRAFFSATPAVFPPGLLMAVGACLVVGIALATSETASTTAMKKMLKNSAKALEEHKKKDAFAFVDSNTLPTLEFLLNSKRLFFPLSFTPCIAEAQGPRPSMEDAHFFKEIEQGVLVGVLDGHGGNQVAKFASERFPEQFFQTLTKNQGNVRLTFEQSFHTIHKEIAQKKEWNRIGSTAILSFIDKYTNLVYTATLGDSEANLYRKNKDGILQSTPLSCVRDWSSTKDAKRAAIALRKPEIELNWPLAENPKGLRFPYAQYGVNVSRALGDTGICSKEQTRAISHKPKITVNKLEAGDLLVLACDGLKDYVPEKDILELLNQSTKEENLAQKLVDYAITQKNSRDNVTVVAVKVETN